MPDDLGSDAIDQLIPALIQCFGVILLGYLAGRYQILCEAQVRGLNSYVTKFALPAVFFKGMVTVDLTGVCWSLVGAISLGKAVVFFLAFVITLLLDRTSPFGMAAILAMFVSQSNDVALGYPVLKALYPELAIYVYLFAPAQLVILNPIAYLFLEWHQLKQQAIEANEKRLSDGPPTTPPPDTNKYKRLLQVIWRVTLNPLFFMTVIGVIFNFILHHQIPVYVDGLLKIIADSFAATALFTLGFGMVGKMARVTQREILVLVVILMIKLVILPFINRELVVLLVPSSNVNETLRYSTFGFLYGAIPTAPPVYLFAAQYQVLPVVTGIGLVLGTFLCAPMIFILARMVTMYLADPSNYDALLGSTVVDISWISIAGCVWTMIILLLSRKAFRVPHRFTCCYLFCILLSCIGVVAGHFLNRATMAKAGFLNQPANALHYLQFTVFFVGCTGTRVWTTLIAFSMFLERLRGVCYMLRKQTWIYLVGFATPVLVTSILLCTSNRQRVKDVDPAFQYGLGQLIVSLVVLLVNMSGTVLFMIWYIRLGPTERATSLRNCPFGCILVRTHNEETTPCIPHSNDEVGEEIADHLNVYPSGDRHDHTRLLEPVPSCKCETAERRRQCLRLMARYEYLCKFPTTSPVALSNANSSDSCVKLDVDDNFEFQHTRHLVLLFFLLTTMFFGICLCTWRLIREAPSGLYLVLEFLDGTFNFGQGIALFIIFGLDADLILDPVRRIITRQIRRLFGAMLEATDGAGFAGTTIACLPDDEEKARQFATYHINSCANSIAKEIISGDRHIKVFSEDALKLWLCESGLVHSEAEAVDYVAALMTERVVAEIWTHELASGSDLGLQSDRLLYFTEHESMGVEQTAF